VPFQIVRGLAFFERKENKDVLAYLRLLYNPRDDLAFERVVNEPARGIGKTSLEHLRSHAAPRGLCLLDAAAEVAKVPAIKGKAAAGLRDFAAMMRELHALVDAAPDEVIRRVLDRSGYRAALRDSGDPEDQERLANIEELITAAGQFAEEDSSRTLADFLESATLRSDQDGYDQKQNCVSVMTLHAAKGLEFPVVYMVAVEQGLLPHERSLEGSKRNEEVEEERRLAFVGITRAMEELHLCHAKVREFRGAALYTVPSMFLQELPQDEVENIDLTQKSAARVYEEWRGGGPDAEEGWEDAGIQLRRDTHSTTSSTDRYAEGMLVEHESYGMGRVVELSGYGALRKIKVRFNRAGEKTFIADKAKLAVVKK